MDIRTYPGDEQALKLFEEEKQELFWVYEPQEISVVLGRGSKEEEIKIDACRRDGITLWRRKGGGGAVVLAPGMLIITVVLRADSKAYPSYWLHALGKEWCYVLGNLGIKEASVKGYGDVCLGERKILGSSIYNRRDIILYQASLLVNCPLELIPRYLNHPPREPDYRRGREHLDFVTSLERAGYNVKPPLLKEAFASWWDKFLLRRERKSVLE
ncbi:hypothetical protein V3F56_09600 [Moorellaceae bacterium AZ2]